MCSVLWHDTETTFACCLAAMTAYNPAVVALNDMLRQQIKLVEQFTESNRRMYEAYTRNLNASYKYTTLEDTMEVGTPHSPSGYHFTRVSCSV